VTGVLALLPSLVTLLSDGELDTAALGHRDPGLAAVADDENVAQPRREVAADGVPDVDNVEATGVLLPAEDNASTALVTTTGNNDVGTSVELDELCELVVLNVVLDGVVDLDERVGVPDGAAVVGDNAGDTASAELNLLDLEELEGGLLGGDTVDDEAALNVVEDAEVLAGLLDRDHVLEAGGVGGVGANLAVDLDEALRSDGGDLAVVERILKSVAKKNDQRQRLSQFVWTGGRTRGICAGQLVEEPAAGRSQALHVLLGSTGHLEGVVGRVEVGCILKVLEPPN